MDGGQGGCTPWAASPSWEPAVPEGRDGLRRTPRFFDMREGAVLINSENKNQESYSAEV
jgi:hypothetical protein